MAATRYRRVHLAAWGCHTPAGDAAASWAAVAAGRRTVAAGSDVTWSGCIPGSAGDPLGLLLSAARGPWRAVAGLPGPPAWGLSASKGDPWAMDRALRGHPPALLDADPAALNRRAALALGVSSWLPCAVVAACSTGIYACLAASDLIERGACTHALAGAVDGDLPPWLRAGFAALGVLCRGGPPQAFGEPTGFAPAPGAGVVALGTAGPWRLVAGVRLGDAGHETHFQDPATLARALAGLWEASPDPELIVTHGTGTAAGDAYERQGLDGGPWRSCRRLACKPWIGHALGASGAVELALACEAPARRIWKLSLGFGGHLAAVALERD